MGTIVDISLMFRSDLMEMFSKLAENFERAAKSQAIMPTQHNYRPICRFMEQ